MRATAGCLLCSLVLLTGCARKLPGPAECRAFALATLGLEADTPARLLERDLALSTRAEDVTRTCLTKPWDYQLLGCLQSGGSQQRCLMGYEQRRALRSVNFE